MVQSEQLLDMLFNLQQSSRTTTGLLHVCHYPSVSLTPLLSPAISIAIYQLSSCYLIPRPVTQSDLPGFYVMPFYFLGHFNVEMIHLLWPLKSTTLV